MNRIRLFVGVALMTLALTACPAAEPPPPSGGGEFGDELEHAPGVDGPVETVTLPTPDGGVFTLRYEIIDDLAIFEGDIVLGTAEELAALAEADDVELTPQSTAIYPSVCWRYWWKDDVCKEFRWNFGPFGPNATVPYTIQYDWHDPDVAGDENATMEARIDEAMRWIEAVSWVRFEQVRPGDYGAWVTFRNADGCSSALGRQGGGQFVNLSTGCGTGSVVHEILHALGIGHEHTRHDRDEHVQINTGNVRDGKAHNFETSDLRYDLGEYDFASIMHYGLNAWCKRSGDSCVGPTIEVVGELPPGVDIGDIGQRAGLSPGDIDAINALYPGEPPTISITEPADGARFAPGEEVWIEAVAQEYLGDHLPVRWTLPSGEVETQPDTTGANVLIEDSLPIGTHTITATAVDRTGSAVSEQLTIEIAADPPEVFIVTPRTNDFLLSDQALTLTGQSLSGCCLLADEHVQWRVRRGGSTVFTASGHVASVPAATMTPGSYEITFQASDGFTLASRDIDVLVQEKPDFFPTAEIAAPEAGTLFGYASPGAPPQIAFSGSGSDPEDGALAGSRLRWIAIHVGGAIPLCEGSAFGGTDASCSAFSAELKDLGGGTAYAIYLEVMDSDGNVNYTDVGITVRYFAP